MSFLDLEAGGPAPGRRDTSTTADPSQVLAAGVFEFNTAVSRFKRLVNTIGTPRDTPELREKLHKTRLQIGQLAKDTDARLKSAGDLDQQTSDTAGNKVGGAKLAKDFQAVLKEFLKTQKAAAERESAIAPIIAGAQAQSTFNNDLKLQNDHSQDQEARYLMQEQAKQDVIQLDNEVVFNEGVIDERDQGIWEINQEIGEVNETFKDLAGLVNDQGVMIDDIDSHIQNSHAPTVQAHRQLEKTKTNQKSGNTMSCLLLVILAVVMVVIIIIKLI